jgi:hypothetical protein
MWESKPEQAKKHRRKVLNVHVPWRHVKWGGGGSRRGVIVPHILNLNTRCRWVVIAAQPVHFNPGNSPQYSLNGRLFGTQGLLGCSREKKYLPLLLEIRPWLLVHPACSLVTVLMENGLQSNIVWADITRNTPCGVLKAIYMGKSTHYYTDTNHIPKKQLLEKHEACTNKNTIKGAWATFFLIGRQP